MIFLHKCVGLREPETGSVMDADFHVALHSFIPSFLVNETAPMMLFSANVEACMYLKDHIFNYLKSNIYLIHLV